MLSWVIQTTLISIIFIFVVHYLINFFKSTLTVPKIKDLVNNPSKKYENMYSIINSNNNQNSSQNNHTNNTYNNSYSNISSNDLDFKIEYTDADLLPRLDAKSEPKLDPHLLPKLEINTDSMKNELKNFLKKQANPDNFSTNISALDAYSSNSGNSYMTF
jgi:hypothetical protein